MDIERYNYVDILFRKFRMGTLIAELKEAENSKERAKRTVFEQACADLVRGEKADDA